jgi:4-hydroxy-tetrahydrodipicolinate synthase
MLDHRRDERLDLSTSGHRFEGVFALLLTPFHADDTIDWDTYAHYVDWQLSHGAQGLFAVCGSSEMKWLTLDERLALASRAVERAGNVPVLATANLEDQTDDHLAEIERMAETGVAAVVLVPPQGLGNEPEQFAAYFAHLADHAPCPVILYEWPLRTPHLIPADLYADLVNAHGVLGIKDTTCTVEGIRAKIDAAPDSVVYQANTPYLMEAVDLGARGIMAITSAAAADAVVDYWQAARDGTPETVQRHRELVFLDALLRFGYPATAKHLAALHGLPMQIHCRWPVTFPAEAAKALTVWHTAYGIHHP